MVNLDNFQWLYIDKPQWIKVWLEETSEMKLARLHSYKNEWQNANKDQGFIEMTHEKKKMTRKEAVDLLGSHIIGNKLEAEAMISFYIEAGMLEIVEEPDYRVAISKLFGVDYLYVEGQLANLGYKIIKA